MTADQDAAQEDTQSRETDSFSNVESIALTGRTVGFFCPCCSDVNLEIGLLDGATEVGCCPSCRGFVLDTPTFGAQVQSLRAQYQGPEDTPVPIDLEELEMRRNCPACREPMEVHPYYGPGNVVIDSCTPCKLVWFNQGELSRIVRAPGVRKRYFPLNSNSGVSDAGFASVPIHEQSADDLLGAALQSLGNSFLSFLFR